MICRPTGVSSSAATTRASLMQCEAARGAKEARTREISQIRAPDQLYSRNLGE